MEKYSDEGWGGQCFKIQKEPIQRGGGGGSRSFVEVDPLGLELDPESSGLTVFLMERTPYDFNMEKK